VYTALSVDGDAEGHRIIPAPGADPFSRLKISEGAIPVAPIGPPVSGSAASIVSASAKIVAG
jgi:hypothetical protein